MSMVGTDGCAVALCCRHDVPARAERPQPLRDREGKHVPVSTTYSPAKHVVTAYGSSRCEQGHVQHGVFCAVRVAMAALRARSTVRGGTGVRDGTREQQHCSVGAVGLLVLGGFLCLKSWQGSGA